MKSKIMFFRFLAGQIFSCFFCFFVYSETLIIQSSDQHSSYKKMLDFLASIEVLSSQFKSRYPDGKIVIVVNGDVSSYAKYSLESLDRGHLIYKTLSQLARKYFVVYTFGNHDAFDWDDSQLFLEQMHLLKSEGVNLVVGNVDFYSGYEDLFEPSVDLINPSGKIIRFIGYTLPYYNKKNKLEKFQRRGPKIIKEIKGINMGIPLKKANRQRKINSVVISMHLGISKAKWFVSQLNPSSKKKLKLVFAGHDHQKEMSKISKVHLIDSGAYFHFSAVILNDKGRVLFKKFFPNELQKDMAEQLNSKSLEAQLIDQAEDRLLDLVNLRKTKGKKVFKTSPKRSSPDPERAGQITENNKPRCIKVFQGGRQLSIH